MHKDFDFTHIHCEDIKHVGTTFWKI